MPYEKAPSSGAFLVLSLMHILSGEPMHDLSGVDTHGVHSADVVLNILARQREPAPPANIMTPAALTLRNAPIADCARYDNLRRTN